MQDLGQENSQLPSERQDLHLPCLAAVRSSRDGGWNAPKDPNERPLLLSWADVTWSGNTQNTENTEDLSNRICPRFVWPVLGWFGRNGRTLNESTLDDIFTPHMKSMSKSNGRVYGRSRVDSSD